MAVKSSRIQRLLIANRGEIAIRISSAARELGIITIAVYIASDDSHISHANEAVLLPNASAFLDIPLLVRICQQHKVDAVHPGYGYLSESAEFASQLHSAGILFVGPSAEILRQTGDKLSARKLAESCGVPVLPALTSPTDNLSQIASFGRDVGWPIMLKAVDGGGGRGIRLVRGESELETALDRAVAESPSKRVFAERAAVGGWRHIEVQILGDGFSVRHFWERECSVQRRYQKIIEIAPSTVLDRELIAEVIESAISIASRIRYKSLGTFEFLVSPSTLKYFFLEINPRLQVEHTITETLACVDLVQLQLLVAQGNRLSDLSLESPTWKAPPPPITAIQLRVTAEDPKRNLSLSIGKLNNVYIPGGNGIRVDTHIRSGTIVSADFDSLLAKIIVSSGSLGAAIAKAIRALEDLIIEGVTTNISLLRGILLSRAFQDRGCDTQWLEDNIDAIIRTGQDAISQKPAIKGENETASSPASSLSGAGSTPLRKGDTLQLSLTMPESSLSKEYTVKVTKLLRNDFPLSLAAELSVSAPGLGAHSRAEDFPCTIKIRQSESSASTISGKRQGNQNNPSHLICPLGGTLVEVLVDEDDVVQEHDAIAVIRQMKMELEVRAQRSGTIKNLWEVDEGDEVAMGMLVCEIVEGRFKEKL